MEAPTVDKRGLLAEVPVNALADECVVRPWVEC